MELLLEMKGDVGEIKGLLSGLGQTLRDHIAEDRATATRVAALEVESNKRSGAHKVWLGIASAAGALSGFVTHIVTAKAHGP